MLLRDMILRTREVLCRGMVVLPGLLLHRGMNANYDFGFMLLSDILKKEYPMLLRGHMLLTDNRMLLLCLMLLLVY